MTIPLNDQTKENRQVRIRVDIVRARVKILDSCNKHVRVSVETSWRANL